MLWQGADLLNCLDGFVCTLIMCVLAPKTLYRVVHVGIVNGVECSLHVQLL